MSKTRIVLLGIIVAAVAACSKGNESETAKKASPQNKSVHGDVTGSASAVPGTPIADALKKKKINANFSKSIGEAFDSYKYVTKREWRETGTSSNKYYVDYICWFDVNALSPAAMKDGIVKSGMVIKFVIHENGEAYIAMATRIEIKSDGKSYTTPIKVADIQKIVTAIYENREISF